MTRAVDNLGPPGIPGPGGTIDQADVAWLVPRLRALAGRNRDGRRCHMWPLLCAAIRCHRPGDSLCHGWVICWTTDLWTAQVSCKLLTENEGLLGTIRAYD